MFDESQLDPAGCQRSALMLQDALLEKDIRAAWDALVWVQGSGAAASPDLLFSHIDRLPTGQLAELVRRINDWLATQAQGGRP